MALDTSNVKVTDWGVIGCAAGVLLLSPISSYVTVSFQGSDELDALGGFSDGISAWSSYAVLGLLLLFAVAGIAAARVFAGVTLPTLPVGWNLVLAGGAALGTLLLVLRAFTYSDGGFGDLGVDVGPGWSGWVIMVLAAAETVFAVLAFRDSGETVSWQPPQRSQPRPPTSPPAPPV